MTADQKLIYRDRIIEELYHTKLVRGITMKMGKQVHLDEDNFIHEDVEQEVWLCLLRMPAERLIQLYEENNRHLGNYIGRIVMNQGYLQDSRNSPYASVASKILHGSTLKHNLSLSPTEHNGEGEFGEDNNDTLRLNLVDEPTEENKYELLWDKVEPHLTPDELEFIQRNLSGKKMGVRKTKKQLRDYSCMKQKIHSILLVLEGKELTKEQMKYYKFQLKDWRDEPLIMGNPSPLKGRPSNNKKKPVYQYTLDGHFVTSYPSCKDAAEALGCAPSTISNCVLGNCKTSQGYIWKYYPGKD